MHRLELIGTVQGVRFAQPSVHVEIVATADGSGFRVVNHVTRESVTLRAAAGAVGAETGFAAHGGARVALGVDGVAGSVLAEMPGLAGLTGGASLTTFLSATNTTPGQMVKMAAAQAHGATWLFSARPDGQGLAVHELPAGAAPVLRATVADTAGSLAAGIAALAAVQAGGQTFLYAASGREHGITGWQLGPGGGLTQVAVLGQAGGLPVQAPTALRAVQVGGETYLVAAAAGSSSLSVMRVGADGGLTLTDHVIDDLGTRFAGATVLDALNVGDRAFILAAGADEGISLFTLAPGGRLIHLATLADTAAMGLANVSAIEMLRVGDEIQVLVASGAEAGLTLLRIPLTGPTAGAAGQMFASTGPGLLEGGPGEDILLDGPGADSLRGGAGADLFVLTADGQPDTILDFQPGVDRIDLSLWPWLRNTAQLSVTPTANGAVIAFMAERLTIVTASGQPLTEAQVRAMALVPLTRMPLVDPDPPPPDPPPPGGGLLRDGGPGPDRLEGTAGDDTLNGGDGADTLIGGDGHDRLSGGNGDDFLFGGPGDDTLRGGAGRDILEGGPGADLLEGGVGFDIASYAGAAAGLRADLTDPAANTGEAAGDSYLSLEGLIGSAHADTLAGDAAANDIWGGGGADRLEGRDGDDTLSGGDGNDTLFGGAGRDLLMGDAGHDLLYGGAGNDVLEGGEGNDTLDPGEGSDTVYGGPGDDLMLAGPGATQWYGGEGTDRLSYAAAPTGIRLDLLVPAANTGWAAGHVASGVEMIEGTGLADHLSGDAGANRLYGGAGHDTLEGREGNDWLEGGDGNDLLHGGPGNDSLKGGAGHDTIHGEEGDDEIACAEGDDLAYGGAGRDNMGGGPGRDTLYGGEGNDTIGGGQSNDQVHGDAGDDVLGGGWGHDTLWGGAGHDTIAASFDNDLVFGGPGHDSIGGGLGNDTLHGEDGNDTIGGGEGHDLIHGGAGADFLAGGPGSDTIWGGDGADRINGGPGNDLLYGGAGADVFVFAAWTAGERDVVGDFTPDLDRLQLAGIPGATAAARFAALDLTAAAAGGVPQTEIRWAGHVIVLEGVLPGQLDAGDFIFV